MRMTHKARWRALRDDSLVMRAEQYARWTLAYLMADPEDSALSTTRPEVERDYQSMGAILVNSLGPKLATRLFPTQRPFFQIKLSYALMQDALKAASESEVKSQLARMEMDACQQLFVNASFSQLVLGAKHLIVTGNVLMFRDSKLKRSIAYGLQQYVVQRDGRGQALDIVLREYTYFDALDQETQWALRATNPGKYANTAAAPNGRLRVELYTRIQYVPPVKENSGARYIVSQEVDTTPVGDIGSYPAHACPYQALTWNLLPGEHYGRGMVEDYAGDFAKASDESFALTLYGINTLKVVNLVASGSGTDVDKMAAAETGEWVAGTPNSVAAYEAGDANKIQVIMAELQEVFTRLSRAFLYSVNQRDAERVTAYELQQAAQELEAALGGIYSSLAETWQVPLAHLLLLEVNPGILRDIVSEDAKLNLSAGIPALGRSVDVQNILTAAQEAVAIVQPLIQLDRRIDPQKLLDVIYAGQSVDTSVLFKSDEQIAQEQKAEAMQAQGTMQVQQAAQAAGQEEALAALQK